MYGTFPKGIVLGFKGIVHEIVGHHTCTCKISVILLILTTIVSVEVNISIHQ